MSEELFTIPESLSPKDQWLKRHELAVIEDDIPRICIGPKRDKPFHIQNKSKTVVLFGDTEDDCIIQWCSILGLKHWSVEEYEKMNQSQGLDFDE